MEINPMKTSNIIVNYTLPHISELFSIVTLEDKYASPMKFQNFKYQDFD